MVPRATGDVGTKFIGRDVLSSGLEEDKALVLPLSFKDLELAHFYVAFSLYEGYVSSNWDHSTLCTYLPKPLS